MALEWTCTSFHELTPAALYHILRLRNEVFVVEQHCVFQDADNKDQQALHLSASADGRIVAYARLLPPGIMHDEPSIGRVAVAFDYRGQGLGRVLMTHAIDRCYALFGHLTIKIGAQLYLKNFYASLGFEPLGNIYEEDGIQHIEMIKPFTRPVSQPS